MARQQVVITALCLGETGTGMTLKECDKACAVCSAVTRQPENKISMTDSKTRSVGSVKVSETKAEVGSNTGHRVAICADHPGRPYCESHVGLVVSGQVFSNYNHINIFSLRFTTTKKLNDITLSYFCFLHERQVAIPFKADKTKQKLRRQSNIIQCKSSYSVPSAEAIVMYKYVSPLYLSLYIYVLTDLS